MNIGVKLVGTHYRIVLLVKIDIAVVKRCIETGIDMRVISLFVPMTFIWNIFGRKNLEKEKDNCHCYRNTLVLFLMKGIYLNMQVKKHLLIGLANNYLKVF